MESSLGGLNYEDEFQYNVKGVNNLEFACLIWIDKSYINHTKHDGLFRQKKVDLVSSIE